MSEAPVRLLYVDDDETLVRLIERKLGRRGYEVVHAPTAEAALRHLGQGGIDVIALDHNLPSGTGVDFLRELAKAGSGPGVVYVTGSAEMDIAVAALKAGASDFVQKAPGEDFLVLLESALQQAVETTRLRSQKEAAEREVRAARDRAELLLREVNHRVANSLALVSSLVGLQAKSVKDPIAKDALAETQSRIFAVASVHQRLYTSDDVRFVAIDEYLRGLLEHLQTSLQKEGMGATIAAELEAIQVPTDRAISLGVVVTELVTNAFKYAYPAGRSGEIRVGFRRTGPDVALLTVADDGPGWAGEGEIKGTGLGSRIVKTISDALGAELRYEIDRGTVASLSLPLGTA
jgi:two-component sensor histidine kinase